MRTKKPFYKRLWFIILAIILGLFVLVLLFSEDPEESKFDPEEIKKYVSSAIDEMGDKTNLKVISGKTNEDGRYVITLSDNTFIFVEDDKVTAASVSEAPRQDVKQSFKLAIGSVSPDMSLGERNQILNKLPLNERTEEVIVEGGITYTYQRTNDSYLLQVKK